MMPAKAICYNVTMTKTQMTVLIERAESWPQEAQEELIRTSIAIEQKAGTAYRLDDEERADIREGLAEIKRGEVASDAKVRQTFAKLRRA